MLMEREPKSASIYSCWETFQNKSELCASIEWPKEQFLSLSSMFYSKQRFPEWNNKLNENPFRI